MRLLNLLVLGSFITSLGTGMTAFGLAVLALTLTGSASSVAAVQLCALAPIILLAPVAGVIADRYDRRLVMVIGDGGSVVGLLVILLALRSPSPSLTTVLAGVLLSSVLASLTEPALRASVSELVDPEQYVKASGLLQAAGAAKLLVSPALAGLLLPVIGMPGIVVIDASTCVVTVICSLAVRRALPAHQTGARTQVDVLGAWRTLRERPRLRRLLAVMTALIVATGTVQVLFKPALLPALGAQRLGVVETVCACGLLAGAGATAALRARPTTLLAAGTAVAGAMMVLLGVRPWLWTVVLGGFLTFAAMALCQAGADALARGALDREREAATWGVISLVTQSGYLVAYVCAAPLVDLVLTPALTRSGPGSVLALLVGQGPGRGAALGIVAAGAVTVLLAVVLRLQRSGLEEAHEPRPGRTVPADTTRTEMSPC